jgi:hypothetical protein
MSVSTGVTEQFPVRSQAQHLVLDAGTVRNVEGSHAVLNR